MTYGLKRENGLIRFKERNGERGLKSSKVGFKCLVWVLLVFVLGEGDCTLENSCIRDQLCRRLRAAG